MPNKSEISMWNSQYALFGSTNSMLAENKQRNRSNYRLGVQTVCLLRLRIEMEDGICGYKYTAC